MENQLIQRGERSIAADGTGRIEKLDHAELDVAQEPRNPRPNLVSKRRLDFKGHPIPAMNEPAEIPADAVCDADEDVQQHAIVF
jgi:hypothetical protein